jgi:hypothetical protein
MKVKENSNLIVFKVRTDDEHYGECSYAILEMSKAYRDQLLRTMDMVATLKKYDRDVFRLELWEGYQINWMADSGNTLGGGTNLTAEQSEALEELFETNGDHEFLQVDELPFEASLNISIQTPTALVQEDSVTFDCYIKHTNIRLYVDGPMKEKLEAMEFGDDN